MSMRSSNVQLLGLDLQVEYSYSPATPGVHTHPNGDPGYPDSPAEVCIDSVRLWDSTHDLSEVLCEKFLQELEDKLIELERDATATPPEDF